MKTSLSALFSLLLFVLTGIQQKTYAWGLKAHTIINKQAVLLLPKEMRGFYKFHIDYLSEHSVDPDKRKNAVKNEGPRHYIDLDRYADTSRCCLPRNWNAAVLRFHNDTLYKNGVAPWWIVRLQNALTVAMRERNEARILKLSADLGHYVGDIHVPLHSTENYDGQMTGQKGLHALWESRIPEIFSSSYKLDKAYRPIYLKNPAERIWQAIAQSFIAVDSVLALDKALLDAKGEREYTVNENARGSRKEVTTAYATKYNSSLNGQVERRLITSIHTVADIWYTAWVDGGQPPLNNLIKEVYTSEQQEEIDKEHQAWLARICESDSCVIAEKK
jgi:hypothetical protein